MSLFTKSIQSKPSPKDGIRICIMRRPDSWAIYDIWMPVLAPSHKLLNESHAKKIDWNCYKKRFEKEVILGQKKFLNFLTKISLENTVTILCWEKNPEHCHRKIVAKACKKIDSKLEVVIK